VRVLGTELPMSAPVRAPRCGKPGHTQGPASQRVPTREAVRTGLTGRRSIEAGPVVELGTPAVLLARDGAYAALAA
jgi:hypothetical protein